MASDLMNPAQCNICEAAAAKFNCNTCGDALCATCKGYHLKSKGTKHHKIVPYAEKLNPKYLAGLICPKHQTRGPKFWCDTCDVPICDLCITSNEHKGHEYSDITATLSKRRDAMLAEMKTIRDQTIEEWEEVFTQANMITAKFENNIDVISKELVARAKEMHKQVDDILATSQKTLQEIKASGLQKLQQQEKYLEAKLSQMKEDVERYENQLRDADPNVLLRFNHDPVQSKGKSKPPGLETASQPVFNEGQINITALQNMFGTLSPQAIPQKSGDLAKKPPTGPPNPQPTASSDKRKNTVTSSGAHSAGRSLIPYPSVQHQFDVGHSCPLISCVEGGLAWVKTGFTPTRTTLQLVDKRGSISDTITVDFIINDMAVAADGNLLLADYNKCFKSVSRQKNIRTLFSTSEKPWGLCCLPNGDIVVTFKQDKKVQVYNRNGKMRQSFDHIKFEYPNKVAVNKVNNDINICDKRKLIAITADGQLRYEYTGQGDSKFDSQDVCTDQLGHILITDYHNHRIHILDQDGQFIQYIMTSKQELHKPTTIEVDKEGYVWVGEYVGSDKSRVNVARYLQ